jgi:hypothetical protein
MATKYNMQSIINKANDPLQMLLTSPKKVSFEEKRNNLKTHHPDYDMDTSKNSRRSLQSNARANVKRTIDNNNNNHGVVADESRNGEREESECQQDKSQQRDQSSQSHPPTPNVEVENEDEMEGIVSPKKSDILSGRGAGVNLHPGNVFFRKLIQTNKQVYIKADPGEKKRIIKRIVEVAENHGRFLKQDQNSEFWVQVSSEDARKKTGQALRENAPAIKKQQATLKRKIEMAQHLNAVSSFLPLPTTSRGSAADLLLSASNNNAHLTNNNQFLSPQQTTSLPTSATSLIWTRMNLLQEKQEQLKRKQRELEDDQHQLMQYFVQMTAASAMVEPNHLKYHQMGGFDLSSSSPPVSDSGSESDHSDIYSRVQQLGKKRRIVYSGL